VEREDPEAQRSSRTTGPSPRDSRRHGHWLGRRHHPPAGAPALANASCQGIGSAVRAADWL